MFFGALEIYFVDHITDNIPSALKKMETVSMRRKSKLNLQVSRARQTVKYKRVMQLE